MPQDIIGLNLNASIDCETTERDLQPWSAQTKILHNTGIARDGGITNLYTAIESNTLYRETLFTRNGKRVRLLNDDINDRFRVFANEKEIGQVPRWAVEDRRILSVDANDVCATVDGTVLVLRLSQAIATIEEVTCKTFDLIRSRTFAIPSNVSDGMFVRNKAPTWANVTSIVGIFQSGTVLNHQIILDSGVVYSISGQSGFYNTSQVFAFYDNGWIVSANDELDARTFVLRSTGVQQGTFTEAAYLVANHNRTLNTVNFIGWRDVVRLGTPGTYANTFVPPAAPGGNWTITALTNGATSPVKVLMTMGGYAYCYGTSTKNLFYANNSTTRLWNIGHSTPPEIYGWLDNQAEIVFKAHTVLGEAAYISASFAADGIGVPITEVGEVNAYYYPQIVKCNGNDYRVMYRRGDGSFATVQLSKNPSKSRMQEIASGVVKINTISALCLADANDNDLQFSGNAYNGFVVVSFDTTAPLTQKAFVARYRGEYGGSVDTNYKDTGAVTVGLPTAIVVPEGVSYSPNNETIDVYVGSPPSPEYYRSIRDTIAQSVKGSLQGTIYVDDTIIPPPQGAAYEEQTIQLTKTTAVREVDYDGYQLLNETVGRYDSFRLYGQLYLFDGDWIHLAQLSAGRALQRVDHVANGLGLRFLAESPTAIYFLSTFDNSIYTFDGGQSVSKFLKLNRRSEIRGGVYNTRENTLALFGDDFILWLRDGVLSESFLPFVWPYRAFSTSDGIWITRDDYAIKYVYNPILSTGGGTISIIALDLDGGVWGTVYADTYDGGTWGTVYNDTIDGETWGGGSTGLIDPVMWQSKFNGFSDRMRQNVDRYLFRVFKEDKAQSTLSIEYQSYREDGQVIETRDIIIGDATNPYDSLGYAFVEFIPANRNAIASAIKISCIDKIIIMGAFATITTAGESVAKNRG